MHADSYADHTLSQATADQREIRVGIREGFAVCSLTAK